MKGDEVEITTKLLFCTLFTQLLITYTLNSFFFFFRLFLKNRQLVRKAQERGQGEIYHIRKHKSKETQNSVALLV